MREKEVLNQRFNRFVKLTLNQIFISEQLQTVHTELLKKSGVKWTDAEERVFQWQIGNLEFACGAKLEQVEII